MKIQILHAFNLVVATTVLALPNAAFGQFGGSMSGSVSITVSKANGVTTTKVVDNGKKFSILEGEDGITVKLTKTYGPDDTEQLQHDYPDLFMHLQSFPSETEDAKVELEINVLKEVEAQNEEELKKEHPEAYKIYQKYTRGGKRITIRPRPFVPVEDPFGGDPFGSDDEDDPSDGGDDPFR